MYVNRCTASLGHGWATRPPTVWAVRETSTWVGYSPPVIVDQVVISCLAHAWTASSAIHLLCLILLSVSGGSCSTPVFRLLDEATFDGVAVHVVEFLDELGVGEDVEVVLEGLPELFAVGLSLA